MRSSDASCWAVLGGQLWRVVRTVRREAMRVFEEVFGVFGVRRWLMMGIRADCTGVSVRREEG